MSTEFDRRYSRIGLPSITPDRLLRALLLQVLYSIRSERQLMEQLDVAATPAIFYLDEKGNLQQQQGAPSPDKLVQILGPK